MDFGHFISPSDLSRRLGCPDAPEIIDICLAEDHALDRRLIPGCIRIDYEQAALLPASSRSRVIVCQKGLKLSQGVAGLLGADVLTGGRVGWVAAGLPLWPQDLDPKLGEHGRRWVLPRDLGPLDLLNAWTIARFVDTSPRWMAVDRDQMAATAQKFDALPVAHATRFQDHPGVLQNRFKALSECALQDAVQSMLQGACALCLRGAQPIEASFALFDALWAASSEEWV